MNPKNDLQSSSSAQEYNFDGLIGSTYNYAGLSIGNVASMKNKNRISRPRHAALEGLEKMKFLMDRGFKQAILPPHERPAVYFLKKLGFSGKEEQILQSAKKASPVLLSACCSASSMWTANSATVSPGADTEDKKVHLTPANLQSFFHRSLESEQTSFVLKKIFSDPDYFVHHPPLPSGSVLSDEGAANHNRFCSAYDSEGVEVFVYGRNDFSSVQNTEQFYPRQSRTASEIIALNHKLRPEKTVIAEQNATAVSAGVFHNDVICVGDQNLIFYHELAFTDTEKVLREIEEKLFPVPLLKIPVRTQDVSLDESVSSYLFNSQLLPKGKNKWMLLAPKECEDSPVVNSYLKYLKGNSVIQEIYFTSVRQSMQNGGGPACLRLRVVLNREEAQAIHQGVCLNQSLYERLKIWIERHYRDRLSPEDLMDPLLIRESQTALDELSYLLKLGNIYSFQK